MINSRSDNTFKFFGYVIALYWTVIWIYFFTMYVPPPETFNAPAILQIAVRVLHIASHASVLLVIHYLGRKKLFRFLCVQLGGIMLVSICISLAWLAIHFQILLVINFVFGLMYVGTLFSIRKTSFDNLILWLAVSETILLVITYTTMFVSFSFQRILMLAWLIPVTLLYLLVQKTRRHLANAELEAGFLDDVDFEKNKLT